MENAEYMSLFPKSTTLEDFREETDLITVNDYWLFFNETTRKVQSGKNLWPLLLLIPHLWIQFLIIPDSWLFITFNSILLIGYNSVWNNYPIIQRRFRKISTYSTSTSIGILVPFLVIYPAFYLTNQITISNQNFWLFASFQLVFLFLPFINAIWIRSALDNLDYTFPLSRNTINGDYTLPIITFAYSNELPKELISIKMASIIEEKNEQLSQALNYLKAKHKDTDVAAYITSISQKLDEVPNKEEDVIFKMENNQKGFRFTINQKEIDSETRNGFEKLGKFLRNSANPENINTPKSVVTKIITNRNCCRIYAGIDEKLCQFCKRKIPNTFLKN